MSQKLCKRCYCKFQKAEEEFQPCRYRNCIEEAYNNGFCYKHANDDKIKTCESCKKATKSRDTYTEIEGKVCQYCATKIYDRNFKDRDDRKASSKLQNVKNNSMLAKKERIQNKIDKELSDEIDYNPDDTEDDGDDEDFDEGDDNDGNNNDEDFDDDNEDGNNNERDGKEAKADFPNYDDYDLEVNPINVRESKADFPDYDDEKRQGVKSSTSSDSISDRMRIRSQEMADRQRDKSRQTRNKNRELIIDISD